jgi:hypothetical protein
VIRPPWLDDEVLLEEVREAVLHAGRVPHSILDAGRAAFARRMSEAGFRLAILRYDSLLDDALQFRAESETGPRIVTFEADSLSVEIELAEDKIVCQLIPPAGGEVTMLTVDGVAGQVQADAIGCFVFPRPSPGPVRFRCQTRESRLVTDWVHL